MTTKRKQPEAWVVKDDEFHPDTRVAALAADQASRKFTRSVLSAELKSLLIRETPLAAYELRRATYLRGRIAEVEQAIKDNEPTTDPED